MIVTSIQVYYMNQDRKPLRNFESNQARISKIKEMKSTGYLLDPRRTSSGIESVEDASEASCSLKSHIKVKKQQSLKRNLQFEKNSHELYSFSELKQFLSGKMSHEVGKMKIQLKQSQRRQMVRNQALLRDCKDWKVYMQNFFKYSLFLGNQKSQLQTEKQSYLRYLTNSVQKRRIMISTEHLQSKLKSKKYDSLQEENQKLKKQLGQNKMRIGELQKKILMLIEQHKHKKQMYQKEIKKLTQIISSSLEKIPQLIVSPFKIETSQQTGKPSPLNIFPEEKKYQYNELSHHNELFFSKISGISNIFNPEVLQEQKRILERLPTFSTMAI